jgi:hypothetical protein
MAFNPESILTNRLHPSRPAILRAAGTETIATEHRPTRRRLERHAVRLAALIASNLKLFAFRSACLPTSATKVRAAGIAAGLATFRMGKSTLAIVVLLSFTKGERISAFGASNFQIWHRCLPGKVLSDYCLSLRRVYSRTGRAVQQMSDGLGVRWQVQRDTALDRLEFRL